MVHGTHNAEADERNKDIKIFINGELLHRDDAKISVFDSKLDLNTIEFCPSEWIYPSVSQILIGFPIINFTDILVKSI